MGTPLGSVPPEPEGAGRSLRMLDAALTTIGPNRRLLSVAIALALLTGLLETALLFLLAEIGVAITTEEGRVEVGLGPIDLDASVGTSTLIAGGLVLVLIAVAIPLSHVMATLSVRAVVRMRTRLVRAYLGSSLAYRATHREGYLAQLAGEYCNRAEQLVMQSTHFIVGLCTLAMVIAGAIASNPLAAAGAVVSLGLTIALIRPFTVRARQAARRTAAINRSLVWRVAQSTRLSDEIAAFNVTPAVDEHLSRDIRGAAKSLRGMRYEARMVPALYQYGALGALIALIGVLSVVEESRLVNFAPLILLMVRGLGYVRQLIAAARVANEMLPFIETLTNEIDALEAHPMRSGTAEPERFAGLELSGVGFEYASGSPVLEDVSLSIAPGEMLGIVGPSGGGKSTLSLLLLRLRSPGAGTIRTGEHDLEEISADAWSRLTAYVPQDSRLVLGTVADNIRFFREGRTDEQVEHAARAAHLHDEIVQLPEGYDTLIGEGARDLSGGQRQRLAIARALLDRPELLVLDEPTSALDEHSERMIGRTLEELKGTTTIVLIAHRPATLTYCDRILRVSDGRLETVRATPAA